MKYLGFFIVFALITPFLISDAIAVPVERVPITSFGAYSSDGKEIQEIVAGTQVNLVSNVTNTLDAKQSFVYGTWISENNGTRIPIDWIETSLDAKSSSVFSISWIPDTAGKYTIEASIWENNETFTAFSAIWQVTLDVITKDSHELKMPLVPEPESEQYSPVHENCGPGTTLQNGICVVDKTKENPSDSSVRWGGSAYNHDIKSPLKQIKSGIAIIDVQCNEGKSPAYKYNRMRVACVSEETLGELWSRGWATMRFYTDADTSSHALCNNYDGKWHPEHNGCRGNISDLQCSLMGGKFVDNLKICYNDICPENKTYTLCVVNSDEPESSDGIFYPRYHVSVFQNTKTMEQYVTPDFITIGANSQVTWSNYDNVTVSLNSVDPDNMWSTSVIPPDGYDTVTFEETGIYEYKGNVGIHGFIVVMDDGGDLLSSKFSELFGPGSPLIYNEELDPVLLYDNCKRYAYWLTEHGIEKINLPEDYPRYPPWGNQIFPLVEFCTTNGELVKTIPHDTISWEFKIENEN